MSVVGIDLGTTNTVVACVRGGRVHVLADESGRRLLPSVVSFHPNGEILVGQGAKERRVVDARNTVASVKRLIGRSWRSEEIGKARPRFAFEMKEGPGHAPLVVARGQEYTLPEISAYVLRKAKAIAERALGEPVERAVITVPANFNELQRASTKVAGRVAGLEVLRILNEPTAAALAYGLGKTGHERIAIYDFGGGTFDCTILDLSGNVFEVLATSGDSFLGGDDVDMAIADRMAESFLLQHRYDPKQDVQAYERLRAYSENIKIELSQQPAAKIHLREVAYGVGGAHLDMQFGLTRAELETIAEPFIERTFRVCQDALALAGLSVGGLDKVILVGGSTRIPAVRRRVEQFFGAPPLDRVQADEVVAIGAAIQAAALTDAARRRSIPPPPVPSASRTTLRGMNNPDPGQMRRSNPNLEAAAAEARKITASGLAGTMRLDPSPPARAKMPSAPDAGATQPMAVPPLHSSTDDEITRQRLPSPPPPKPSQPTALGGANISDLADTYANIAPTRPGAAQPQAPAQMAIRDPASILASTLPIVAPRVHDPDAQTVPGEDLAAALAKSLEDISRDDVPTAIAPAPNNPPAPSPMNRTMQMREAPVVPPQMPVMPTLPIVTPSLPKAPAAIAPARPPPPPSPPPPPPPPPPPQPLAPAQQTVVLGSAPPVTAYQPAVLPPSRPPAPPLTVSLPPGPLAPPLLVDVTPRALVVETVGGYCDTIVTRNSKIPCERTRAFSTVSDGQTVVRIRVAQGEAEHFGQNVYLGEVELAGLRPAARGEVTISVTFGVDANGTLQVSATDIASGRAARATLQLLGVAREDSIAQMRARVGGQRMSSPPS